jgi:hypothetical protein
MRKALSVPQQMRFQMDSGQLLWGMTTLSLMRFQPGEDPNCCF